MIRQGEALPRSQFRSTGDGLADGAPHRAADEPELDGGDHQRVLLDPGRAVNRPLLLAGLSLRLLKAGCVRLDVDESKRVAGLDVVAEWGERVGVYEKSDTLAGADAEMVTALGADLEVTIQTLVIDKRAVPGAFYPSALFGYR